MTLATMALIFSTTTTNMDLPKGLLSALCYVESAHKYQAINYEDGSQDSIGVCQLHPTTARLMGFKGPDKNLMIPSINAFYAAKYLKKQLRRYSGDVRKAVAAYNSGKYIQGRDGSAVNQHYVNKVFSAWANKQ